MRIASATLGWAIQEIAAALPPHFLQRRTSSQKTLWKSSDQVNLLSRRLTGSPWATSKIGTVASRGVVTACLAGSGWFHPGAALRAALGGRTVPKDGGAPLGARGEDSMIPT